MTVFSKIYKHTFLVLVSITGIAILEGCKKDFLDRDPQGSYTSDTYPYPTGSGPYDGSIFAAYDDLRGYNASVSAFVAATSIRSDDADKGSTPADGPTSLEMDNFTILPTNGLTDNLWSGYYSIINKCNIVLAAIANDPDPATPREAKISAEAEVKFLRGYSYFMLVRLFGRIPLVDTISANVSQSNIPQSNPDQTYAFIESDLKFAAENLPATWDTKFIGRSTKGAANGILAKVYLTQKKWSLAMSTANLVITSGVYDLSTPYNKIFSEDGENLKESLFEVQAVATPAEKRANGSQFASVQGVRGTGIWNLGWGFNIPSAQLEAAYEAGDPRKARTILYAGGTSVYGEAVPLGLPNPKYNHKVHSNPSIRNSLLDNFSYWMNIRLLRYADVVLMYAEAANETGNTAEALAKLEMVRARARAGNNAVLPKVTTTDQALLRESIRHERRIELAMEHDRFFDLVRWGIAGPILQAAGKNFVVGKHELLPIPQTQIDISKGVLKQNPGY